MKWIIVWGSILVSMIIYFDYPVVQSISVPRDITRISVPQTNLNLTLNDKHQWQQAHANISTEQQELIQRWIKDLQTGCSKHSYSETSIGRSGQHDDFMFRLNDKPYRFGTFNTYAEQHYLYHDGQAYLCLPTLRPRLENAHRLWITTNA